ncbi:MAG: hypothetical protein K2X77_28185 [Candidatus Obscuribacterales bacterium]|jgi:hypothetical protein|nr:hypothetical protein [Candidatus Obscuribacterales bacterium]
MVLNQVPRHSRRDFTVKVNASACGILGTLNSADAVECELDFNPPAITSSSRSDDSAKLLAMLAGEIQAEHGQTLDFRPPVDEQSVQRAGASYLAGLSDSETLDLRGKERLALIESMRRRLMEAHDEEFFFDEGGEILFKETLSESELIRESNRDHDSDDLALPQKTSPRMHLHVEVLSGGKRVETFDNGSRICKDALGRVTEIFSSFGDSFYFNYGEGGELFSFTRTNKAGKVHSKGQRGSNSVTIRDAEGRVKAIGECMSVDPWGCFYVHSKDGQYFCLDLVGGIHSERRRLVNAEGKVEYITSAFAHDGFRMATLYASASVKAISRRPLRSITYRFYGRDGTAVEFVSEDHLRESRPSRSLPPGSFPVNSTWIHARQAHTAWESVKEYLSRVS